MTFLSVFDGICCAARCSVDKTDTARAVIYEKTVANDIVAGIRLYGAIETILSI